jgi:hypothetical protein
MNGNNSLQPYTHPDKIGMFFTLFSHPILLPTFTSHAYPCPIVGTDCILKSMIPIVISRGYTKRIDCLLFFLVRDFWVLTSFCYHILFINYSIRISLRHRFILGKFMFSIEKFGFNEKHTLVHVGILILRSHVTSIMILPICSFPKSDHVLRS